MVCWCKLKVDERNVSLVLWDTAGQEAYDRLRPLCYQRAGVVIVCFSVNSRSSFENVEFKWVPEVRHHCAGVPVVLVATKTDLRRAQGAQHQSLTTNEGDQLARRLHVDGYVECSSKTGDGVAQVFQTAAREVIRPQRPPKPLITCRLL